MGNFIYSTFILTCPHLNIWVSTFLPGSEEEVSDLMYEDHSLYLFWAVQPWFPLLHKVCPPLFSHILVSWPPNKSKQMLHFTLCLLLAAITPCTPSHPLPFFTWLFLRLAFHLAPIMTVIMEMCHIHILISLQNTFTIPFRPHNNPVKEVEPKWSSLDKRRNWASERLRQILKVTQLVSSRAWTRSHEVWL